MEMLRRWFRILGRRKEKKKTVEITYRN